MTTPYEVLVEVRPDPHRAGNLSGQSFTERFANRVDELGAGLSDIANRLRDQLEERLLAAPESQWGLDEISLSFSLDLEAEAGVVVARTTTKAGFEATLTWKRKA